MSKDSINWGRWGVVVAVIPIVITIIICYPTIKPKSGYLPKSIDTKENNKFSIEIENRGQVSRTYKLKLSSSFIDFNFKKQEHDNSLSWLSGDLVWFPIDLGGGKTHIHNVEVNGLKIPSEYNSMNSNAYIELKILNADDEELFQSRCYYLLEETGGFIQPRYANFENPVLDTTGNSQKHREECKVM